MGEEKIYNDLTNRILLLILAITIVANGLQFYFFKANERFDWTFGVISSKGNVVQVSDCGYEFGSYNINKNMILDDGWSRINEPENDENEAFLPDSLSLIWFSYNEQKFYHGNFSLPKETVLTKARQIIMIPNVENDYNSDKTLRFIAEIQPQGRIIVWLQKKYGENNKKLKIGTYQGKETKATWHVFDDYSETDTISDINIAKKVALVMEKHTYKLEIKLPIGYTLNNSYFDFFNQNISHFNENDLKDIPIFNSLPQGFYLTWVKGRKKLTTQFIFDENEVLNVFRKENNSRGKLEPLILELVPNEKYNVVKVILKNTNTNSEFVFKSKY